MIWIKEKQYLACRAPERGSELFSGRDRWCSRLFGSEGANALGAEALLSPEGAVTFRALQQTETLIICGCFRRVTLFKIPVHVKKHFEALRYSSDNVYKYCLELVKIQLSYSNKSLSFSVSFQYVCSKLYTDNRVVTVLLESTCHSFEPWDQDGAVSSALICHFTDPLSVLLPVRSNTSFYSLPFVLTPALVSAVMW